MSSRVPAEQIRTLATVHGPARVHLSSHRTPAGLLVLGHGAGGGVDAPDLLAARAGAWGAGWSVALVEQPWRVAGRRIAGPPPSLDAAWLDVVTELRRGMTGRLVLGGRSAGARVACRTAAPLDAQGVLALAFPLVPPESGRSRLAELELPTVPVLVVQGSRDPFGCPAPAADRRVEVVEGADHRFHVRRKDGRTAPEVAQQLREVVSGWLQALT